MLRSCGRALAQPLCRQAALLQQAAQGEPIASTSYTATLFQQHRYAHKVKIILQQDHEHLGHVGDVVEVRAGYMRTSLYPNRVAVYATPANLRKLEKEGGGLQQLLPQEQQQQAAPSSSRQERELLEAIKRLTSKPVVARMRFRRKAEGEPQVGSIGPRAIARLVAAQMHVDLPPELIHMPRDEQGGGGAISEFGEYKVPLDLRAPGSGSQVELAVTVLKVYRS